MSSSLISFSRLFSNRIKRVRSQILSCRLKGLDALLIAFPVTFSRITASIHSIHVTHFILEPLRALYLGDNEFEVIPGDLKHLKNLQVVRHPFLASFLSRFYFSLYSMFTVCLTRIRSLDLVTMTSNMFSSNAAVGSHKSVTTRACSNSW